MEERQRDQAAVARLEVEEQIRVEGVEERLAMRQQRALGITRRARGVEDRVGRLAPWRGGGRRRAGAAADGRLIVVEALERAGTARPPHPPAPPLPPDPPPP